jgi:hypothetical protein
MSMFKRFWANHASPSELPLERVCPPREPPACPHLGVWSALQLVPPRLAPQVCPSY